MKFCIKSYEDKTVLNTVDEIIIDYHRTSLDVLKELVETVKAATILIYRFKDLTESDYELIAAFAAEHEIKVGLTNEEDGSFPHSIAAEFHKRNVPYYSRQVISNWDDLENYLRFGVSDVLIGNALGFECAAVREVCGPAINIHVYVDVAQSITSDTKTYKRFFIRPEDIDLYAQYIDTFEIWKSGGKAADELYKIYSQEKKWFGELSEIITNLGFHLDSRYIMPQFGERRMNCGRSCMKGGPCRICPRLMELSSSLKRADIIIEPIAATKE